MTEMLRDLQRFGVPACSGLSVIEVQLGVKKGEEEKTAKKLTGSRVKDIVMLFNRELIKISLTSKPWPI
ncbi:MAG: hypothetical protein HY882_08270 [Deltaproteobacteria bacterium]|nr:hypothetical protein [Deltaproteobacteria bacterium]